MINTTLALFARSQRRNEAIQVVKTLTSSINNPLIILNVSEPQATVEYLRSRIASLINIYTITEQDLL